MKTPEVRENAANAARKIAVIGAGPSGLSCAYFLARLGYRPVIFEGEPRPGGMLVQTIPAYRLPREILAREIRMIENMGVTIKTGMRLGVDFTLSSLRDDGWEAAFVGVGAQRPVNLSIPGETAEGVVDALHFLRQYNLKGSVPVGKNVVVIGGGNAAVDAARTAVRLGAEKVTIIYRRTREEMPAYTEEIEEAEHENVTLLQLTAPVEVKTLNNRVTGIACHMMRLGQFDSSGRRRPEDAQESVVLAADQIIAAIGQKVDTDAIFNGLTLDLTAYKTLSADKLTGATSVPWIFAGGDVTQGPSSVVEAIAEGERAAVGIDLYLTGENHAFWRGDTVVQTAYDPDADPVLFPRENLPLIDVDRRKNNFDEVEMCWTEGVAIRQTKRCLRCDYGKTPSSERR
jgi:NADH-quinone oxidoreductase subunit F